MKVFRNCKMHSLLACMFAALILLPTLAYAANGSVVYTYDALGRITTVSYDTGVLVVYTYDANGNRLSQTVNVSTTTLVWGSGNWGQTLW
jgi:YD repeat-containing protein